MYSFEIIGDDVNNKGKIVNVILPNGQIKEIVVRFQQEDPTESEINLAIENSVSEIQINFEKLSLEV